MATLKSVLEEIRSGTTTFAPASSKESDMWDFQPIAKVLLYAHNEGFLEGFRPHKESRTSNDWYDLILVQGGLSYKGEQFLIKPIADVEKKMEEIIQLKPELYGLSIDLKALWKKWKARKS